MNSSINLHNVGYNGQVTLATRDNADNKLHEIYNSR